MQETTKPPGRFPDDELRRALQRLVRMAGLLEPQHLGVRASLSEVMALGELADVDEMSQTELARRLGLEKSTVSRLAAKLENRGWVDRQRDETNRRFYRLRLTPCGHTTAQDIGRELRAQHARLMDGLSATEVAALTTGLAAVARVLDTHQEPSQGA